MKTVYLPLLLLLTLTLILGACTNSRISSQANMHVDHLNIQHRQDIANQLFDQRDFYGSLIQWKILRSIQPKNLQYKNRIRVLQSLIRRRLKTHLNAANIALDKNDTETAERELLKVLALDPSHSIAIYEIKNIEKNKAENSQATRTQKLLEKHLLDANESNENGKPETSIIGEKSEHDLFYLEVGIELFNKQDWRGSIRETTKYLNTHANDKKAINILTTSHLNLSKKFEDRGHLEPAIQHMEDLILLNKENKNKYAKKLYDLKRELSAHYYIDGIKVYRDNIDQAIIYWERAIKTNPDNEKANIRLRKAKKMKEKLNAMRAK